MTRTPTPAEIETLRDMLNKYVEDRPELDKASAILDRLSPPEPEQPDEATLWTRKVVEAWHGEALDEYEEHECREDLERARKVLAELIASKDGEREKQNEQLLAVAQGYKLDKEEAESELATLRAENERLKADAAATEAKSLRLAWETARGTNADMHKTPLSAYQTIVWALKKLYDGASLKAAERNTAEQKGGAECPTEVDVKAALADRAETSAPSYAYGRVHTDTSRSGGMPPGTNAGAVEVTEGDTRYKIAECIISEYHTTRLISDPATHVLNKPSVKRLFDEFRTEAEARGRRDALDKVKREVDRLFNWHGRFPYPSPQPDAVRSGLHEVGLFLKRMMTGEK